MPNPEARWARFIDFAATVSLLLTDAQYQIDRLSKVRPVSPAVVDELSTMWNVLVAAFTAFSRSAVAIRSTPDLTPEQTVMASSLINKINDAGLQTNVALRGFFRSTNLIYGQPSREEAGEGLWRDVPSPPFPPPPVHRH